MNTSYPPFNDTDTCPASLIQRQFWVLHGFAPDSPAYNIPLVNVITGSIDVKAMETAINTVVRKYRVFRATFEINDSGELLQRFSPWDKIILQQVDLRTLRDGGIENEAVEQVLGEEAKAPFDLAVGPLFRFKLFRTGDLLHILSITVHHIVFDLATSVLFAGELAKAYSDALTGNTADISIETAEYAHFCQWQERWFKSDERTKMEAAWMRYFAGTEPAIKLPYSFPRKNDSLRAGAIVPLHLPGELSEKIDAFCRKESVIPFLVLLTAWSLTIARLCRQCKLTVGVPLTNRRKDAFKKTMGCFVNILPLAVDLSDNPTNIEMLRQVRTTMLKMHRMQEVPYYHLVQMTRQAGIDRGNPLFQVGFTFENLMRLQLEGLVVTPKYIHHGGSQLDLFAKFWQETGAIQGVIEYDRTRFDSSTAKRIGEQFVATINEICTEQFGKTGVCESQISYNQEVLPELEYPPLSDFEKHRLLFDWNDTRADYPIHMCIHGLFEEMVGLIPEAIAVEYDGRRLTYSELDDRSNQLAQYLRELGVVPDTLVAIYLNRSLEMVITLLGVLKAGGAYLPLDGTFPGHRLAYMLEDARPRVLVTVTSLRSELPPFHSTVVCVDDFPHQSQKRFFTPAPIPESLAYVLYTSGSTGKPKGVEITHRAVVNFLTSMRKEPGMKITDTLLSITTISFDIFGLELWLPLTTGAKVVIVPQHMVMDGILLGKLIAEHNVTIMQATPVTWQLLLESGWQGKADLKILCGGEAWSRKLADSLLAKCASLWNMYGPTETTIWSAIDRIRDGETIALGRPIANTQFYVVDSRFQLLPPGIPGELLIGGDGLARGYLNLPEMTAEKFIPDPFSGNKGARLYRTGDKVRYMPDGRLEFIGRLDQQIKIRGFRIELGDIESVLCAKPGIKQAAITVHEEKGEKYLVAYVVFSNQAHQTIAELRSYLKQKLPHYMVPERFVILPAMPLTPNGKINRKTLIMPKKAEQEESTLNSSGKIDRPGLQPPDHTPPQPACLHFVSQREGERLIEKIWQDTLGLESVGLDDNFFDLGGHSLLLVRVANRIQKSFNKDISVMDLFERPTVRGQAGFICDADSGNISEKNEIKVFPETTHRDFDNWEEGEI